MGKMWQPSVLTAAGRWLASKYTTVSQEECLHLSWNFAKMACWFLSAWQGLTFPEGFRQAVHAKFLMEFQRKHPMRPVVTYLFGGGVVLSSSTEKLMTAGFRGGSGEGRTARHGILAGCWRWQALKYFWKSEPGVSSVSFLRITLPWVTYNSLTHLQGTNVNIWESRLPGNT